LLEDCAEEQGRPSLGLAKASHEQAAEGDEPWTSLTSWDTQRQQATGGTATATDEPMLLILGDDRLDLGEFPNLMADGLEIGSGE
jgi:hypothetical protein